MGTVVVVSPHPDDESLGCAGAIRKHVLAGDDVRLVFLTSGEATTFPVADHDPNPEKTSEQARVREAEARAAAVILGVREIEFWRQRDGRLAVTAALVVRLREKLTSSGAVRVYVTHEQESHPDHRAAGALVRQAVRGTPALARTEVRTFEVWTPIQHPVESLDITDVIETKRAAIRAHASQCAEQNFEDAMISLSRYRGLMSSWPRHEHAEVFGAMV